MKTLILSLLLFISLLANAQTDSTYYEKRDSQWVEIRMIVTPVTKVDTLVRNTLMNQVHDNSLQLFQLRKQLKVKEKEVYQLFRRNNRQLKSFGRLPEFPKDTLRSNWLLDGNAVTIRNDRIGTVRMTWFSPVAFEYQNQLFIKQENDIWISDKSRLEKVKPRSIK